MPNFRARGENIRKTELIFFNLTGFWDSRRVQLAIYTVFDEESESEVENCQILHLDEKI